MRILAMPRYASLGASSRLRTLQYVPGLRAYGHEVHIEPLLDNEYIEGMYANGISKRNVIRSYCHRILRLLRSGEYDVMWVEKELLPWIPALLELRLIAKKVCFVVDYDDAIFHRYDLSQSYFVRALLGRKIDAVMRRADLTIAGNAYLADRAKKAGCQRVEWLPTVVDLERYPFAQGKASSEPLTIGWIGSPSTVTYLRMVTPVLAELSRTQNIRCVAIGARPDQVEGTPFEAWDWTEQSEVASLRKLDIGIMPLADGSWERGKCGYKLIQYMACGIPVVASPVGANNDIVQPGVNGFLAAQDGEWIYALDQLLRDHTLRVRMGTEGRKKVEGIYCLQAQAPRFNTMLESAVRGKWQMRRVSR